jgi:NAD(P)-dependent dehydrogenase (short-subunit alcohol dehydrogenase family)
MGVVRFDFTGASVFVTGGTGGMGRAIASAFIDSGASVCVTDLDAASGDEFADSLNALGRGRAMFVPLDVSSEAAVREAVSRCVSGFGGLDHAVNAAAIEGESVPLHEVEAVDFERTQQVNVRGVFFCMKYQLAAMLNGRSERTAAGATIVNIASTNSFRPQPNQSAYTSSKHAVLGLTRSAAIDYAARGIRINAICPGAIDTPMLRNAMARRGRDPQATADKLSLIGRFGTPEEIAQSTLWLCSEGSSYTMGHPLAVDAGYLTR